MWVRGEQRSGGRGREGAQGGGEGGVTAIEGGMTEGIQGGEEGGVITGLGMTEEDKLEVSEGIILEGN